jgi:hypothetical protein
LPESIQKEKILLVEGQDEEYLFTALIDALDLVNDMQIIPVGGITKLGASLKGIKNRSGYNQVTSIGIIRDADNNAHSSFLSVCSALHSANLPEPSDPLQPTPGPPQVTILIVPDSDTPGMIENVCLNSVTGDPAIPCLEQYFRCLQENLISLAENNIPKATVRTFLASRELLEIEHFEYLQRCMEHYEPIFPTSPSTIVPKIHTFLASRFTPDLDLGIAGKEGYWDFDHHAFDTIKQFLHQL